MGEYAEYGSDQQGWYGMFVACGMWCLADISSVSPSSEQTLSTWLVDLNKAQPHAPSRLSGGERGLIPQQQLDTEAALKSLLVLVNNTKTKWKSRELLSDFHANLRESGNPSKPMGFSGNLYVYCLWICKASQCWNKNLQYRNLH